MRDQDRTAAPAQNDLPAKMENLQASPGTPQEMLGAEHGPLETQVLNTDAAAGVFGQPRVTSELLSLTAVPPLI